MPSELRVSVTAEDLIGRDTPITVSAEEPIDPRSAQGEIGIRGRRVVVRLADSGRTAEVQPAEKLPPGRHHLVIGELLSAARRRLAEPFDVPFLAVDTAARIPAGLGVEGFARIGIGQFQTTRVPLSQRPSEPFIDLFKTTDRTTGEPFELAFDESGTPVDPAQVLGDVARRRAVRYGKIHESLERRMAAGGAVPVAFWAAVPAHFGGYDRPADRPSSEPEPEERRLDVLVEQAADRLVEMVGGYGAATPDRVAPVVYATLHADAIMQLAGRDEVAAVFLNDTEAVVDLRDSMRVARSDVVHDSGLDGTGVRVAVWEFGPDDSSNLQIVASFDPKFAIRTSHARLTHAIIKNTQGGRARGHAPGCELYSANSSSLDALVWAVRDQHCTVVSQSFHRSDDASTASPSFNDVYKDYLVLRWPHPTIVQAAGNYFAGDSDDIHPPYDEYVNHKGYNGLTVGSHDDTATAMASDSAFRNPASPHADRELPELAANGTGVTAAARTDGGTSFAAPAVAGCVALIQQVDAVLRSWPQGCRAIMLAGAGRNPEGAGWQDDLAAHVDAADGAGALDALESVLIARARGAGNAPGTRRGWDVGTLKSQHFTQNRISTFAYRVEVPKTVLTPFVKVALAWDSTVAEDPAIGAPLSTTLAVDLDLLVRRADGTLAAASNSRDNSYEICEFPAAPGETYEIRIRRWSGTVNTWFGIAWTVRGTTIDDDVSPPLPS